MHPPEELKLTPEIRAAVDKMDIACDRLEGVPVVDPRPTVADLERVIGPIPVGSRIGCAAQHTVSIKKTARALGYLPAEFELTDEGRQAIQARTGNCDGCGKRGVDVRVLRAPALHDSPVSLCAACVSELSQDDDIRALLQASSDAPDPKCDRCCVTFSAADALTCPACDWTLCPECASQHGCKPKAD
ncbi:MAG: hypothetical protein AMXMBFR7_33190 [Planctomycetota bacterium]